MRYIYQGTFRAYNELLADATVTVYLTGTTTLATIYAASSGGTADADSAVLTDSAGGFKFYVDEVDYMPDQLFDITLSKTGYTEKTYSKVSIFPSKTPNLVSTAVSYAMLLSDDVINCTATATITLLTASTCAGKEVEIRNSGSGTVTITGSISGVTNPTLAQYECLTIRSDGTVWYEVRPVADESITNAKLAHIATATIKGRVTAATGDVEDLTAANVRTIINVADGANAYVHPNHSGDVTSAADGAQTIAAKAVHVAMLADGTDGEIITWDADGVAATVAVGTATHVLTSNGTGAAPTFQAVPSGGSSSFPTGAGMDYFGVTEPTGWLFADSKTIGDASSGGTARANADAETLFALLWAATANTELIIQDSSGNPTTRGASAAADFAAHKRMPLPDKRGRVSVVKDNMGGTSANRVTSAQADLVCGNAGAETHTLSAAELPAHDHGAAGAHTHTLPIHSGSGEDGSAHGVADASSSWESTGSSGSHSHASVGSGTAHNNMSPYLVCNYIIKY